MVGKTVKELLKTISFHDYFIFSLLSNVDLMQKNCPLLRAFYYVLNLYVLLYMDCFMPKFSQESFSKLSTCHPDLQALFYEVIKYCDCTILEGYRNERDQDIAFSSGHSKLQYPHSMHNYTPALAVDVTPDPINLADDKKALWFGGYVLGIAQKLKDEGKITHSIRWGGSWNGFGVMNTPHMLNDLVHFEILE